MAMVQVKGTYLNAVLQQKVYEGKTTNSIQLDIYQPTSPDKEKTVSVKIEDITLFQDLTSSYTMGDVIEVDCLTNAYKNATYYKFVCFSKTLKPSKAS